MVRNETKRSSLKEGPRLFEKGCNLLKRGDFEGAIKSFSRCAWIQEHNAPGSVDLAHSYHNLGAAFYGQSKYEQAVKYYEKVIAIRERKIPGSVDLALSYHGLGLTLGNQGKHDQAAVQYQKAIAIYESQCPGSVSLACSYNNLGVAFERQGKYDQAADYLQIAIAIREREACGSVDIADSYHGLGAAFQHQGMYKQAVQCHQKATSIRERKIPGSVDLARSYNSLGVAFNSQGHHDQALEFYQKAIPIYERQAPGSVDLADSYHNLGVAFKSQSNNEQALEYYRKAIPIYEREAPGSVDFADSCHNLGVAFTSQNSYSQAAQYYKKAIAIYECEAPRSVDLAHSYVGLGDAYSAIDERDEAVLLYNTALRICEQNAPKSYLVEVTRNKIQQMQSPKQELTGATPVLDNDTVEEKTRQTRERLQLVAKCCGAPCEIPLSYVELVKTKDKLGEGFFGVVYKGRDEEIDMNFAIKVVHEEVVHQGYRSHIEELRETYLKELKTLREFHHPNIARLYGYHLSEDLQGNDQCLLFELAEKGSLDKFWEDDIERQRLDWRRRLMIALEVGSALSYLHLGGDGILSCFHRDVKSANVCLKHNFSAQLIDCGLAKLVHEDQLSSTSGSKVVGTPGYVCPEYQSGEIGYCSGCDVFSYGIFLFELLTGRLQNSKGPDGKVFNFLKKFVKRGIPVEVDELAGEWDTEVAKSLGTLAIACSQEEAEDRPSIQSIVGTIQDMVQWVSETERETECVDSARQVMNDVLVQSQCRRCMVTNTACLPCNNSETPHLHCKSCMESHVRDNCGIPEIVCLREDCPSTPFSHDQLCSIVSPTLIGEHEQIKRQETFFTRLEKPFSSPNTQNIGQEISCMDTALTCWSSTVKNFTALLESKMDVVLNLLTQIGGATSNRCPRHFILLEADRAKIWRNPRSWSKSMGQKKFRLFFVCGHSGEMVEPPVKVVVTKDWLIKVAPALSLSLFLLRSAYSSVTGININISVDQLRAADDELKDFMDESQKRLVDRVTSGTILEEDFYTLSGSSYELVADKVRADGSRFRDEMVPVCDRNKAITWVKNKYACLYQAHAEMK